MNEATDRPLTKAQLRHFELMAKQAKAGQEAFERLKNSRVLRLALSAATHPEIMLADPFNIMHELGMPRTDFIVFPRKYHLSRRTPIPTSWYTSDFQHIKEPEEAEFQLFMVNDRWVEGCAKLMKKHQIIPASAFYLSSFAKSELGKIRSPSTVTNVIGLGSTLKKDAENPKYWLYPGLVLIGEIRDGRGLIRGDDIVEHGGFNDVDIPKGCTLFLGRFEPRKKKN